MGKTSRQKSNKETEDLNNATCQLDLTDVYRTLRPAQQNTHPSQVHTEHLQTDHMAGHKTSLRRKKDLEVIESTFSGHSGMKLAIWKTIKFTNTYKLTHSTNGSKRNISKILKEK